MCSIVSLALEVSVPLDGLKSFSFVLQEEEDQQHHPYLLHKDSRICHHQLPFHIQSSESDWKVYECAICIKLPLCCGCFRVYVVDMFEKK